MKFEDVLEKYLEYAKSRHKKQGFIIIHQNFNNYILPHFIGKDIRKITKEDIVNWQNIIISKNYSNKFKSLLYSNFSCFIKYCILYDYLKENIVLKVGPFPKRIENKKYKVYNIWQFKWFRLHLNNFVIRQYFNFMYFYGTRPSEAMGLRFKDIDGLKVKIRHSLQRKGKRELDTPKNMSSIRTIKINLLMRFRIFLLSKYYGEYNEDYFIFGGKKPLAPTTIDRYKKNACNKAHIYCITQHEFRHSFATRMISKRKPINKVSKIMGHSNPSITLQVYTH